MAKNKDKKQKMMSKKEKKIAKKLTKSMKKMDRIKADISKLEAKMLKEKTKYDGLTSKLVDAQNAAKEKKARKVAEKMEKKKG